MGHCRNLNEGYALNYGWLLIVASVRFLGPSEALASLGARQTDVSSATLDLSKV